MTKALVYTVRIEGTGIHFSAPAGVPLLQAAEMAETSGLKLESSCRNGTCRTCICRLIKGEVTYRIEWPGLSLQEKHDGFILPCVAYPVTDLVIQRMA